MEYSQNYSYQGMNNVASMQEAGPVSMGDPGMPVPPEAPHHHPGNNQDSSSVVSGMTDSTMRPANGVAARDAGAYPPQPQQGGYRPPYNQQQQPPMYSSTEWNHNQQPQRYSQTPGPIVTGPGTAITDYESGATTATTPPYHNGPPAQLQRPPFNGNGQGRPDNINAGPASHAQGGRPPQPPYVSGYDSDSSDGFTTAPQTAVPRENTSKFSFLDSLKDSLQHLDLADLIPFASLMAAGLIHFYRNRGKKRPAAYSEPGWHHLLVSAAPLVSIALSQMKGRNKNNATNNRHGASALGGSTFGGSRYGGGNGSSGMAGAIPWGTLLTTLAGTMMNSGGHSNNPYGNIPGFGQSGYGRPPMNHSGMYPQYGGGRPGQGGYQPSQFGGTHGGGDPISKVMGKIMGSLFKGKQPGGGIGTRDLESSDRNNVLGGFDESWAVQKFVAEHYYRHVYRKKMDLRNASAKTLGGAAAIRALREEERMSTMLTPDDPSLPKNLPYDQLVMGVALSEVSNLLDNKAAVGPLHPEETMEFVGKIALATLIKIKMDEEYGMPRKSHSEHRLIQSSDRHRSSNREKYPSSTSSEHHRSSNREQYPSSSSSEHHRSHHRHHNHGSSSENHRSSRDPNHRHSSSSRHHGSSESGHRHRSSRRDHERSSRNKDGPSPDAKDTYHSRPINPLPY
ncbi:hypothetical protein EV175_005215 [Coemansia sp. RSA 1933]|nr:hypothetical protein EV175_005215 [Coemansia sp. RSA 1933]